MIRWSNLGRVNGKHRDKDIEDSDVSESPAAMIYSRRLSIICSITRLCQLEGLSGYLSKSCGCSYGWYFK